MQDLKALADDVVALLAADAGHQAHAAGIVLMLRMVESLRVRDTTSAVRSLHGKSFVRVRFDGKQVLPMDYRCAADSRAEWPRI